MYVRIKKSHNECYDSTCFGIVGKGWGKQAIVLNKEKTNLVLIDYYKNKQNPPNKGSIHTIVFPLNSEEDGWLKKKDCKGFDFVLGEKVLDQILEEKQVDDKILEQAKKIDEKFELREFFEIKTEKDAQNATECANGFHDAYLIDLKEEGDYTTFVFDTTWGFDFVLKCESKGLEHNLVVSRSNWWFHGDFKIQNGQIIFDSVCQVNKTTKDFFIKANSASFKIVVQNMEKEFFDDLA